MARHQDAGSEQDDSSDRYAVIGQPIAHSQSPRIHAMFSDSTGEVLRYGAIEVAVDALADRVRALHAQAYLGLNVTLPHKQTVLELCENVTERARLAGAVNTLIRSDSGWNGDNTDGVSLLADLKRIGVSVAGRRVLIVGAGGAARGIVGPLLSAGPAQLVVSNRNPWKPEAIAELFSAVGKVLPRTHLTLKGDRYDVVINATSAGHGGSMPRLPGQLLADGGFCYDLSYGEAHAPFVEWSEAQGAARIEDGLGMLVAQAAASFEIWRGTKPEIGPVLDALRGRLPEDCASDGATEHQPVHRAHVELPPQD